LAAVHRGQLTIRGARRHGNRPGLHRGARGCSSRRMGSLAGAPPGSPAFARRLLAALPSLMQLVQQQLGDHVQAGHEVTQAVCVVRSERFYRPGFQLGRVETRGQEPDRQLHGRCQGVAGRALPGRGLIQAGACAWRAPGVPAIPAAAWPPAAALGRGARRVVLPAGGHARLAGPAMDPHTWQHGAGREVVHRRLPGGRYGRQRNRTGRLDSGVRRAGGRLRRSARRLEAVLARVQVRRGPGPALPGSGRVRRRWCKEAAGVRGPVARPGPAAGGSAAPSR
jgi:hypothetical protein